MPATRLIASTLALLIGLPALAGNYFVDNRNTRAADTNDGSDQSPFKTIAHAADIARAGDTVTIRTGLYPESITTEHSGTKDRPIRFMAAPDSKVIVTGADVIKDWKRVDGTEPVYVTPWDHIFEIDRHDGVPIEHHPADAPLWGRAEQVMRGAKQLLPTASLSDLRTAWLHRVDANTGPLPHLGGPFDGWFFADTKVHKLYVILFDGSDPAATLMQASTRGQLFGINPWQSKEGVHHVEVNGIVFQFASNFPQRPAVWLHGTDNLLENCEIVDMSGSGVAVNGTMRHCIVSRNGHTGGSATGQHFVNDTCSWEGNSWKPINRNWEAGGAKVALSQLGVFKGCSFVRNGGPGLWLDVDVRGVVIEDCKFFENEKSGLMVEISRDISITGCEFSKNGIAAVGKREDDDWGAAGLLLAESRDCTVQGNSFTGNRNGISIREIGPRQTASIEGPDVEYHSGGHVISSNDFVNNTEYQLAFWYDNPFFGPHPSAKEPPERIALDPLKQKFLIDANRYNTQEEKFILWGVPWRKKSREFKSIGDLRAGTGFEAKGSLTSQW